MEGKTNNSKTFCGYSVNYEGKELKTLNELQDWYLNKLKELKRADKDFDELHFAQDERKYILNVLKDFVPEDNESELFKNTLSRYLAGFLNTRIWIAKEKHTPAPDPFPDQVKWFQEHLTQLKDSDLKKRFIEAQIERTKRVSLEWIDKGADLNNKYLKANFDAGQKFLEYLKIEIIKYNTPTMYDRTPIVYDRDKSLTVFFNEVHEGKLTQLEIYNYVQKLTDNFEIGKLEIISDDFDFFLFIEKENKGAEYSHQDVVDAINKLLEKGKEIPYIKFPPFVKKHGFENIPEKILDKEKLLYPHDFFTCYQFEKFLDDEIKKRKKNVKNAVNPAKGNHPETFDTILTPAKANFLLQMLEDLGLTKNGKSQVGPKGAHQIRTVVEAAIEKNILPKRILFYTNLLCEKINHPIASKVQRSKDFDSILRRYKGYIDSHYKPVLTD